MGAYNVINRAALAAGQPEDISVVLANLDAIAAILNGGVDNTNINGAAAIAYSKIALANAIKLNADVDPATSLAIARLAGYPADGTKFPAGDGVWKVPVAGATYIRKTTAKLVNSAAETDLLNGEITVPANPGTSAFIRLTAWGDNLYNNGIQNSPRFKVNFGGTTVLDSNVVANFGASATRGNWRAIIEILNLGVANSQLVNITLPYYVGAVNAQGNAQFTTGTGYHKINTDGGGNPSGNFANGLNTSALDTATAKLLEFKVTLPSAIATEWKLFGAVLEIF